VAATHDPTSRDSLELSEMTYFVFFVGNAAMALASSGTNVKLAGYGNNLEVRHFAARC